MFNLAKVAVSEIDHSDRFVFTGPFQYWIDICTAHSLQFEAVKIIFMPNFSNRLDPRIPLNEEDPIWPEVLHHCVGVTHKVIKHLWGNRAGSIYRYCYICQPGRVRCRQIKLR